LRPPRLFRAVMPQTSETEGRADAPSLADGVELIGEYQGSGFEDPPYLARRGDGQVVQMKRLLYLVAEELDGERGYEQIAGSAAGRYGVKLQPEQAQVLVERLEALGIAASSDGTTPTFEKRDPLIALKLRTAVVPARVVAAVSRLFAPLFLPLSVVLALLALVALDVWLFGYHGIAPALRATLYHPALLLLTLALIVLSTAFHECGHAAACRYGGATPGRIGMGIFVVWPAFYTDVTDAYRLSRAGRLRTDLGGVYFNGIFALAIGGAYFATGYEPLLLLIPLQHAEILHQLLPFIRLDGYYVVSDLAGVPDMASRIKPTLASLLPWKCAQPAVRELKPWVRVVTRIYVLTLVPVIVVFLALLVLNLPRMLATAWDSGGVQAHAIRDAFGRDWLMVLVSSIELALLVVIPLGTTLTLAQLARRIAAGAWRTTDGRPAARAGLLAAAAGAAAFAAYSLAPSSAYRPIRPGEKGTIRDAVRQLGDLPARAGAGPARRPAPGRAGAGVHRRVSPAPHRPRTQRSLPTPKALTAGTTAPPPSAAPNRPAAGTTAAPGSPPPSSPRAPATTPAGTVGTPPARTVSTPAPTVSTPAATATAPSATVTTPAATVTTPTLPLPPVPPVPTVSTPVPVPAPPTVSTPVPVPTTPTPPTP
jgi:putative peptide zinc metalloprotease protein